MESLGIGLISKIIAGEDGSYANDLLVECFRGFPIHELRQLLNSDLEEAVRTGVWILSELGIRACPLVNDVAQLMGHPSAYVRFFAIDVVQVCTTPEDAHLSARTINAILDEDETVRWKALRYLSRVDYNVIVTTLGALEGDELITAIDWLIRVVPSRRNAQHDIADRLCSTSKCDRMVAVVAASRLGEMGVLEKAVQSSDFDISQFAKDELKRL